jgi:hypothetical protein
MNPMMVIIKSCAIPDERQSPKVSCLFGLCLAVNATLAERNQVEYFSSC